MTSISDPKRREIRVKKRLHKREKKKFSAKNYLKKREMLKILKNVVFCIFINKFFQKNLFLKYFFKKKFKSAESSKKERQFDAVKEKKEKIELS